MDCSFCFFFLSPTYTQNSPQHSNPYTHTHTHTPHFLYLVYLVGSPDGAAVKNLPANIGYAGDVGSILGQKNPLE